PISRICWTQRRAEVSPSCHTSWGSEPNRSKPGSSDTLFPTDSSSPSRSASKNRMTTCRSSSDGSTRGVSPSGHHGRKPHGLALGLNGESNCGMERPETLVWDAYARALPSMLDAVGRTPLVRLARVGPEGLSLLAKIDWYGPTGSTKDRIYPHMNERHAWRGGDNT